MIHICNVERYHAPSAEELQAMRESHVLLNSVPYERKPLFHGYTDRLLTVDVGSKEAVISEIPAEVKEKFIGGKATACAISGMRSIPPPAGILRKMKS